MVKKIRIKFEAAYNMENKDIINDWELELLIKKQELLDNVCFFNVFKKMDFFESFFKQNSLIRAKILYDSDKKAWILGLVSGDSKDNYVVVDSDDLKKKYGINPVITFPVSVHSPQTDLLFTNDATGHKKALEFFLLTPELMIKYEQNILERKLPENHQPLSKTFKV